MQTRWYALVVAFDHLGNLFIMSERKRYVNVSFLQSWWLGDPTGRRATTTWCSKGYWVWWSQRMHHVLVLLKKENRGSNECSLCMCRSEMISCQQIKVQGCFRDYKGGETWSLWLMNFQVEKNLGESLSLEAIERKRVRMRWRNLNSAIS